MPLFLIYPGIILYCLHGINFTISELNYVRAAKAGKQIMDSEMTPPFLLPSLYQCVYSYFIFFLINMFYFPKTFIDQYILLAY